MQISETDWVRKPQEHDYWFSGQFKITDQVKELLDEIEIMAIYFETQELARKKQGLGHLQIFERSSDGKQLWFIDNLTRSQIKSGEHSREENYCTLMVSEEH